MSLNADQWLEFYKYIASIGAGATAAIMFAKMYFDTQKAKTSMNPQLEQTMVSNIEKDSHVRREFIEAQSRLQETQTRILERLADTSLRISDIHNNGQKKTEDLHALTRREIAGLGERLGGDLKTIQTNQEKVIELVGPISERFRTEMDK